MSAPTATSVETVPESTAPVTTTSPSGEEDEEGAGEDGYVCALTGLALQTALPLPPNDGQDDLPMGCVEISIRRRAGLVPRAKDLIRHTSFSVQQALAASLGNMEAELAAMKPKDRDALVENIRSHLEGTVRAQFAAERVSIGDLYEDEEETIYIGRLDGAEDGDVRDVLKQIAEVLSADLLVKQAERGARRAKKAKRGQ